MFASYHIHDLVFRTPAKTSRNTLESKRVYLLEIRNKEGVSGYGEISPFPGLSVDDGPGFLNRLNQFIKDWNNEAREEDLDLEDWPSIRFGLECALTDLQNGGQRVYFDGPFVQGKQSIPINGLIWMDDAQGMLRQVEEKINQGFTCIKMKIGALDFDEECRMLEIIRKKYTAFQIELRVDANGAFPLDDAATMLKDLSRFELHSIEQPIRQGHWEAMAKLCKESKLAIALDEELLGISPLKLGESLLKTIDPQYLILKPGLLGGFETTTQWIRQSRKWNIPWWITSALEANLGLAAIAQYTAQWGNLLPQGLGTGKLFEANFPSPLRIHQGHLLQDGPDSWQSIPALLK
ncbi:MAG: o-succinylbenzoate synthase [Bacteroidota bacterium]|nr:o-succinylbenzoate synthase [Bacteroidota bacterium]MDX5431852.1 o-succinylbenzoate synthase [Bacteroidota bacterium]MDX5470563.1 o-succinylbenzoate synthase [Bacteroidota bacterium]